MDEEYQLSFDKIHVFPERSFRLSVLAVSWYFDCQRQLPPHYGHLL
jgi:hypothetical protein